MKQISFFTLLACLLLGCPGRPPKAIPSGTGSRSNRAGQATVEGATYGFPVKAAFTEGYGGTSRVVLSDALPNNGCYFASDLLAPPHRYLELSFFDDLNSVSTEDGGFTSGGLTFGYGSYFMSHTEGLGRVLEYYEVKGTAEARSLTDGVAGSYELTIYNSSNEILGRVSGTFDAPFCN